MLFYLKTVNYSKNFFILKRYIYGFEIDFELSELYDSYWAADYYLLHHFDEALSDYINDKLNVQSSILIYEQLSKIGKEVIPLANVRSIIQINSKAAFESEYFLQIGQETLIGLLSLDEVNVEEIELLMAVSKWIDSETQRQGLVVNSENRRKVFEPIKSYILFTAMTPEQIANCKEILELLTVEEIGSVLLHQLNKNIPLLLKLKTSRIAGTGALSVFSDLKSTPGYSYTRSVGLKANRRVGIRTIYCSYSPAPADLSLEIRDSAGVLLDLKIERSAKDDRWSFSFHPPLDLKPYSVCELSFRGTGQTKESDQISEQLELEHANSTIFDLTLGQGLACHCIRGLDFFLN